jgi:FtsP/CotA-like multicopper oxidase with cupredoxin domain
MINRRQFLYKTGVGSLALLSNSLLSPSVNAFALPAMDNSEKNEPDLEFILKAIPAKVHIFSGPRTDVWVYRGEVLKGDPTSIVNMDEESYLGPILRVKKGQRIRIHFQNALPASSIIHWHGLHVPADMDGHPSLAVPPEGQYTYEFKVRDRAGTYWYHPHPHGRTGFQVYGGMAGLFLVSDDTEKSLNLPTGNYEVPLAIQDRTFSSDNQLVYLPGGMMNQMTGMLGNTILVNGIPDFRLEVSTRIYRLRLLNGSNARAYNLAWSDGTPIIILGTDGGFLSQPFEKPSVMLGPGERLDVWADFSKYAVGDSLHLVSRSFEDGVSGMMGGRHMGRGMMSGNQDLPNGAPFNILQVQFVRKEVESKKLPQILAKEEPINLENVLNADAPRAFELSMFHMHGLINGRSFKMTEVAEDEIVAAGTSEIWDFNNTNLQMGMMGIQIPHPMHIHGAHFRVLERSGNFLDSYLDEGWKDTVLLMPGEKIRLLVNFGIDSGLFLYHCHNLEHGDAGMMRNYYIRSTSSSTIESSNT